MRPHIRHPFDPVAAHAWLVSRVGWHAARELVNTEAAALGVDPASDIALKHALATHTAQSGESPRTPRPNLQEGLIP